MSSDPGRKDDKGKDRFDLIDPVFLREMAKILTWGAGKYDDYNWQKLEAPRARWTAALHRHLNAHQGGEVKDPETGQTHMAHVAVNAMFLEWTERNEEMKLKFEKVLDKPIQLRPIRSPYDAT